MPDPPDSTTHHRLSIRGSAGHLRLDVDLNLAAPWTVIYGPSGSGKSTILRAACGLLPGVPVIFERRADSHWHELSDLGHSLAPHRRGLGYAPQQAALFPHLTVRENVFFASASRPRQDAHLALADQALDLFNLRPLANRRPHQLSGGEQQRVNLARACAVPDAHLLLLDEPFAGADRALRDDLLARLQPWLAARNLPVLSVTHDVDEAVLLRAEVVLLDDGRVIAQGPAAEVLAPERRRMLRTLGAP